MTKETELTQEHQGIVLELMQSIKENKDVYDDSYSTIIMALTSISKEVNKITVTSIVGNLNEEK